MRLACRAYLIYLGTYLEGFLHILQVDAATGDDRARHQLALVTGKGNLVDDVVENFIDTSFHNVLQEQGVDGGLVFQRIDLVLVFAFHRFAVGLGETTFQGFGILLLDLLTANVLRDVVSAQRDDCQVAEDVVLIDRYGGRVRTKVDERAARTLFGVGQYGIRQSQRRDEVVRVFGNLESGRRAALADVLPYILAGDDVQETTFEVFRLHADRVCHQFVADLVFLRCNAQNLVADDGHAAVAVLQRVNQFL